MLSVADARARILSNFKAVEATRLPIAELANRVLAEDIRAKIDLPLFDNSSVDGFAVLTSDIKEASAAAPHTLKVVADIRAGSYSDTLLQTGQCARIMTGAPLPPGAQAVVMLEDTDFNDRSPGITPPENVVIYKPVHEGENVRKRGMDLHAGQNVLAAGAALKAQDLGLLAMLGEAQVSVYRKPRVALLSSGDELVPVDAPLTPGKIHDSNSYILAALCESAGAELVHLGVARDNAQDVQARFRQAVEQKSDVIISSAGVSVGAFDYVKSVVEAEGKLDFWKVNMRPGKPLAFGAFHDIPFFGLPGNPVSAFVGFEVFVRPALEKLSGKLPGKRRTQKARLLEAIESDGRESYLRAIVDTENDPPTARLTGHQGSGNVLSLVQANALLIVASGVKSLPAGSEVEIWFNQ